VADIDRGALLDSYSRPKLDANFNKFFKKSTTNLNEFKIVLILIKLINDLNLIFLKM